MCPWNVGFAQALKEPTFAPRAAIAGKDERTLAREVLAMKRNAAVVPGNVGTPEDVDVLTHALDDGEPLVRAHAASALASIRDRPG